MCNKLYWKKPKCILHPIVSNTIIYCEKWVKAVASLEKRKLLIFNEEKSLFNKLACLNFIVFKLCCILVIQAFCFDYF